MTCYQFLQTLQLVPWFDNSKFLLPEDAQSAFTLLLLCSFLNLSENRRAPKPFFSYIELHQFENLQGFSFVCF